MKNRQIFAFFVTTILLIDAGSAGLLQSIRDAAFLKDVITDSLNDEVREARTLSDSRPRGVELPPFSNIPTGYEQEEESSFFDRYSSTTQAPTLTPCPPGDFLCLAKRNMKQTLGSEMSNAIITSVANLMTEMLNSTISRSLDIVQHAQGSHDAKKEADARAAVNQMTNTISTVSSKVIQGLASFIKVSLSGAMWDMFNQVMKAGRGASSTGGMFGSARGTSRVKSTGQGQSQGQNQESTEQKVISAGGGIGSDPALVTPNNVYLPTQNGNEIKRSSSDGGVPEVSKLTLE